MFNKEVLKELKGKKIALLGLGLENRSLLTFLDKVKADVNVTICDQRSKKELNIPTLQNLSLHYQLETKFNYKLYKFDILFRSPGWPLFCPGIDEAKKHNTTVISSPLNLFFSLCPSKNIIGVTGTKGKGTTSSLIYEMIKANGQKVFLGGNIGVAPIDFLETMKKNDYVILELSSFQLEDLNYSPHISVITNFYHEHLAPADPNNPNFHYSTQKYWEAKLNICSHQTENDYLIANIRLKEKLENEPIKSKIIYFSKSNLKSKLMGTFNQENVAAAIEVAKILNIPNTIYKKVLNNFSNLEHRLEFVAKIDGVEYYNNSFSTTPESTILDLNSFLQPIVQIAGGADKGSDFNELAKEVKSNVKYIILLPGGGTPNLKKALLHNNYPNNKIKEVIDMKEAVNLAHKLSQENDIVLLSTACASFGIFKNYKERGNLFKKYVQEIK